VLSFGLLFFASIKVFTGAAPFGGKKHAVAMLDIMSGMRPPTNPTFTAEPWTLMRNCWNLNVHLRPEVSEVLQVLLAPSVPHSFWRSPVSLTVPSHGDLPTWKRLTNNPLSMHECIPLMTSIFSDRNDVDVVGHLSGDDAQAFVDVIYEVSIHTLTSEERIS